VELEYFDSAARFDGRIELVKGMPAIFVNVRGGSRDDGRVRFTLAHEVAHFYLHGHLLRRGASFDDRRIELDDETASDLEREANTFASELLIPSMVLEREMKGRPVTVRWIKDLATRAATSLQSTAIRAVTATADRCCVYLVSNGVISWCAASDDWRTHRLPGRSLKGRALPPSSISARRVEDFEEQKVQLSDWTPQLEFRDIELYESAITTPFGRLVLLGAADFDV
jgi:hypothetical protein